MKTLQDYLHIRGVCHNPQLDGHESLETELGYCQRLQLNSFRYWMKMEEWEKRGDAYFDILDHFMRTAWEYGISSMPILWNGNFIREWQDPSEEWYEKAEAYAKAFIDRFIDEPFILMWDVINEPFCNDYMNMSHPDEYEERFENIKRYVRRLFDIVRRCDPNGCITVGHERVEHCVSTNDLVDVISFHCYRHTRHEVEASILEAEAYRAKWDKPIINTETGCVGRANPYEVELELLHKHQIGFYLFNLVSQGFWGDIHGLVYPDGTIRDPSVIAALFGFFRNRTPDRILSNPNKEGHAYHAVKAVEDVLRVEQTTLFMQEPKTTDDILEAAEYCVNILECNELVPMWDAPSAKIEIWRKQAEDERDIHAIKRFAYDMAQRLREQCLF